MKLTMLVGPCGAGKTTYCEGMLSDINARDSKESLVRISQDDRGKQHMQDFHDAIQQEKNIVVDRMGFSKEQRSRYIIPARKAGYEIEIVVFHVPRETCFERIMARKDHPTIHGKMLIDGGHEINSPGEKARQANSALDTFFLKYERVEDTEANKVTRLGWTPDVHKSLPVLIVDLDGTLCNIDHRLHHVKNEEKKKRRWDLFFKEIPGDSVNEWCRTLITRAHYNPVIFCSGRGDDTRKMTEDWLLKHGFATELYTKPDGEKVISKKYKHLFMRHRQDYRADNIVKEIILEFELKTRYNIWMAVDDRDQVVKMWRKHGITCLQCAEGDF